MGLNSCSDLSAYASPQSGSVEDVAAEKKTHVRGPSFSMLSGTLKSMVCVCVCVRALQMCVSGAFPRVLLYHLRAQPYHPFSSFPLFPSLSFHMCADPATRCFQARSRAWCVLANKCARAWVCIGGALPSLCVMDPLPYSLFITSSISPPIPGSLPLWSSLSIAAQMGIPGLPATLRNSHAHRFRIRRANTRDFIFTRFLATAPLE